MQFDKKYILASTPVLIAIIALIFLAASNIAEDELYYTGIIETTEIDVASKIPGRISEVLVDEGSLVKKGDILARLESKELDAKVEQARGAKDAAFSKLAMVKKGAREEEKLAVKKLFLQAKHQYEFVGKTWERMQNLYADSVISAQERDEIEFKFKAAEEQMGAAKAKYDMVLKGARPEEISAVTALSHQAENAYNEAMAYYAELELKAPLDGEVTTIISNAGEVINTGYPLITILDPNDFHVVLQIREDYMVEISMEKSYPGTIPALGDIEEEFQVAFISSMADFATWKPTNQKGGFDLKSFEVHLKSINKIENLRPGMTVNLRLR